MPFLTPGLTAITPPMTGSETLAVDTNTAAGVSPQYASVTMNQIAQFNRNTWTQAAVPITDAASITTDASLGNIFTVTLAGNRTLANPTNLKSGQRYSWIVTQDGTGSRTLAYGSLFKFPGGAPTATTTAAGIDVIDGFYDGTALRVVMTKAYA